MNVHFACDRCQGEVETALSVSPVLASCSRCGESRTLTPTASVVTGNMLDACSVCGCELIYTQRDFNRKVGLAIVAVGAVFSIYTYGISLLICALIDYLLYRWLPEVSVCYRCQCVYRGYRPNPKHGPYDIHTAEIFATDGKAGA